MAWGSQLTRMPSKAGSTAATPRKVSGGVGALTAVDEPPAAGLDAGVAVHALGAGLDAAAEEAPVSWVLVVASLEEAPAAWVLVVVVVVVLVGAAAVTGLRLRGTSSLLLEDRRPAARLGKSEIRSGMHCIGITSATP